MAASYRGEGKKQKGRENDKRERDGKMKGRDMGRLREREREMREREGYMERSEERRVGDRGRGRVGER